MKKWWKKYLRYYIRAAILLPIFLFFNLLNKFSLNKPKPVFVLSYTGMLGDLVVCSSLFSEIKKSHPNHKIIFLGQEPFTLILKGNPYIDELISYKSEQLSESFLWPIKMGLQLRRLQVEYYVNLTPNYETNGIGLIANPKNQYSVSTEHETKVQSMILKTIQSLQYKYDKLAKEYYADVLKQCQVEIEELKNQLYFAGGLSQTDQFFHNIDNSNKIIGVSVLSGKSFKKWPTDKWVSLINKLAENHPAHFVFFGSQDETDEIRQVSRQVKVEFSNVIGLALDAVPYYLKKCDLFISVDTGPLYIADALQVPVVDILGPCDEITQRPENNYRLVTNRETCQPISKILLTPQRNQYPKIEKCFDSISVEQVFNACQDLLA